MTIQTGQSAPSFSLFNTERQKVSLSDFSGEPVLLLFFPFAFSSTCTAELCSVRDNMSLYQNVNAHPIAISTDSLFSLARFREEQKLPFPLLSDYNKEVSEAYGALYEDWGFDYRGVTKRAAFLIDKDGVVQYEEVLENASDVPDFKAIEAAIARL